MKISVFKPFVVAVGVAVCAIPASAETVLKMASVAPSTSPWGKWATEVAAKIEEASAGELKIDLLLDAQAGDEQTIIRQTAKGRLDIAFVSNTPLTLLSGEMALPSAPFLFDSVEQGTCVAHQHMAKTFGDMMEKSGVVPLTWMEVGQNIIFSKTPVRVPSDLAGLKVRTGPTKSEAAFADAVGASGVPMGTTDTIPALQTGTVDAAIFPTVFGIAIGTHKVAPNVTVTNHARLIGTVAVSARVWATLSDQEKEWLGIFTAAGPQLTAGILGAETALLGKLEAAGIPIYRPADEEAAQWKAATVGIEAKLIAEIGGEAQSVADALGAAKAACGS